MGRRLRFFGWRGNTHRQVSGYFVFAIFIILIPIAAIRRGWFGGREEIPDGAAKSVYS
jgi:hypothetical protein